MAMMKNTGMLWIGQIPVDWELGKVKYAFNRKKEKSIEKDPIVLSLARAGVKIRDISTNEGQLAASYEGYNPVEPNDLLLNPMDLVSGANCSISKVSGVISPAYVNLRAKTGFEPRYYDYYFKTQYWNMGFFVHGKGVSFENRWTLNDATLKDYYIPMPLLYEQQAIVDYLDEACSKIDEIITEAKASIDEYKKLKQSVIFEAVTKGLDKNVEMKDSGVEWMGVIPKHWSTPKLKYFTNISSGGTPDRNHYEYWNGNVNWIKTGELQNNELYDSEEKISELGVANSSAKLFKENTILIAMYGQGKTRGMTALLKVPCTTNQACAGIVMKSNSPYEIYYLWLTLQASYRALREKAVGTGQPNLSIGLLKDFYIPLPTLQEQKEVINFLKKVMPKYDSIIAEKESLINDLEAYKKSLIYEVVTGKRRVV